jgi:hypothetical protein
VSSPLARIATLHRMDTATWERHASPWSVWTRVPILPLATLVLYARPALGSWTAAALLALAAWAWVNPRAFPPPRSTASWASRAVMGERIWLERDRVPIPTALARSVTPTLAVAVAGLPPLAWGLWQREPWPTLAGLGLSTGGKVLFLERMVRLYDDMAARHPIYRAWLR